MWLLTKKTWESKGIAWVELSKDWL